MIIKFSTSESEVDGEMRLKLIQPLNMTLAPQILKSTLTILSTSNGKVQTPLPMAPVKVMKIPIEATSSRWSNQTPTFLLVGSRIRIRMMIFQWITFPSKKMAFDEHFTSDQPTATICLRFKMLAIHSIWNFQCQPVMHTTKLSISTGSIQKELGKAISLSASTVRNYI